MSLWLNGRVREIVFMKDPGFAPHSGQIGHSKWSRCSSVEEGTENMWKSLNNLPF